MSATDQPMLSPGSLEPGGGIPGGPRRPSAASIRPRGILKNAPSRQVSLDVNMADSTAPQVPHPQSEADHHRLQWDEGNLALHDYEREQTTRMTIDEPKTPFVSSANLAPDDLPSAFSLDSGDPGTSASASSSSYFPASQDAPSGSTSGSRRGSTASSAEITARNTMANAQLGRRPSATSAQSTHDAEGAAEDVSAGKDGLGLLDGSATENMAVDELEGGGLGTAPSASALGPESATLSRSRNNSSSSRTPSFSLPRAGAADPREAARAERDMQEDLGDEVEEEDEDEDTKAKHAAFAAKRNQHYGNEAEAMRIAAALAEQEADEEEEEEDEGAATTGAVGSEAPAGGPGAQRVIPPVPPMPSLNGNA
ncbi:unnamed protein product [Tilletia controversa]|uniref:Protein phosphatase inhibitor 2 n=1 Tax=Tilletia controversa TaxID=13291 RepID=A0A8X7MYE6_9BASI|nr:hypothetical protein CF328_g4662 [Tilletia controversa]KAE8253423.1 hypothetical protein A4X06_0g1457 [Tilletia controversa]CAD6915974.1 unnamed protein product [Tilletia controversa]CAD6928419.1 unnamed protein product [Tilletia controversa]CAD6935215.1 unnamed protein product [Tilletia controversa]